ncbi:MAG: NUDIX hydrolase [Candidatus Krumholzibacteriia bacterium]
MNHRRLITDLDVWDHAFPFCPRCRQAMERRRAGGALRPVCPACGFVQYINPAPGAGVIIMREDRVCLVRRRFEPRRGQWTLPIGFMEWGEEIQDTAVREAWEETGLDVAVDSTFGVYTGVLPPNLAVVVAIFRARETGGELRAGDDAAEVGFYPLDAPPGAIAFGIHRHVLRELRAEYGIPDPDDVSDPGGGASDEPEP